MTIFCNFFNIFLIFLIGSNFFYGKQIINKYNKGKNINLNTKIKIVSPNIKLDRFFQNEDPSIIINELIELSKPSKDSEIFVFPEGILANIFLEDLYIYKENFKSNFSKKHKILIGINSYENSKIYNSMVVFDNNLNILEKKFLKTLQESIKNYWSDDNQTKLKLQKETINKSYSWNVRKNEWIDFLKKINS